MAGQEGKQEPLCIGDYVCLYDEEKHGYVMNYQTSSVHNELSVCAEQSREFPVLPNSHAIIFQICVPQRYKCQKKLPRIKAMVEQNASDIMLQSQFAHAQKAAQNESNDNQMEQERQTGKQVLYGQTIQLKHIFTKKWIHVNPIQTSYTEPSNMTIELRPENAKSALFRIMPRSKVKSEGEVVQLADQTVFESIKSAGSYLHCSRFHLGKKMVCSDCYELNLSVRPSGLTIYRSFKPNAPNIGTGEQGAVQQTDFKTTVLGGDIVRFYHREVEAYLTVEGIDNDTGEDVHLRVRRMDATKPKSMYPSSSAIVYWQLERENGPTDGESICWDDFLRLRHPVTRMYLTVTKEGQLKLVKDNQDSDCLFRLHPVVKRGDNVTLDTAIRIEHATTGFWLHGHNEKTYVPKKTDVNSGTNAGPVEDSGTLETLPWTTAERKQITALSEMKYDDAFSIQKVDETGVDDMNYVAGMVPFLHKFGLDIAQNNVANLEPRLINKVETAIKELRDYIFIDGTPNKQRQKLLRNYMIVDMAVQLLKFRTSASASMLKDPSALGGKTRSAVSDPKAAITASNTLEPIYGSLISLLSAYVNGESRKNELYLGRHMDFFLSQIEDTTSHIGLTATQMTVELLKNNRILVDRITKGHIDKICNLVKQNVNYRYLDLLASLCVCDGAALSRNQDYIAMELIEKPIRQGRNVFLLTELGQNVGRRKNAVYISWDHGRGWQVLHDFTTQSYGTDYYLFLKQQLDLYSALCSGRNGYVVHMLVVDLRIVTWEECYICLTDKKLADEIRAIYSQLLYDLFINIGSNFVQEDIKLVYNYDSILLPRNHRKNMPLSVTDTKPIPLPFIDPLKLWINDFLVENDVMVASNTGRNTLISEVLELVRRLALLGYYEDFKEIKGVLDPIMGLLEGSDDLPYQVENIDEAAMDVRKLIETYRAIGRYLKNGQNAALCSVKIGACHASELLFHLRASVRLNRFISEFKQICAQEGSNQRHELGALLYENYGLDNRHLNLGAVNFLRKMFSETNYVSADFVDVALDLCRYEFEPLVAEAMFLLHRYHNSFEDMLGFAKQTQLLVTEQSKRVHAQIADDLRQLRLMLADGNIDAENGLRMKTLLEGFAKMCYLEGDPHNECHPINQQMLTNYGVLGDIFDIITGSIDTEKDTLADVYQSCVQLLMALAHSNPTVQMRLFDRMGTFLKNEGVSGYMAELFVEIFAGNTALCLRIPPQLIMDIVTELAKTRSPTLIRLLISLVMIGNNPLKRNQQLVIKALLQYKQSIEIVVDTTAESRMHLMAGTAGGRNALDQQRYIANIVQLLAYCSQGDNKTVESICQTMFTLPELLDIILLPNLCDGMRCPFVQFLVAVFFTSNLEIAEFELKEMAHEPKLWTYIDSLCRNMQQVTEDIRENKMLAKALLKNRPIRIHTNRADWEAELKESLHYVFDGVLPFLTIFFRQFYRREIDETTFDSIADAEESAMVSELIIAEQQIATHLFQATLVPFAQMVHGCLSQNEHLQTLITCVLTVQRSTGLDGRLPRELSQSLQQSTTDPIVRYRDYYAEEQRLNMMLCHFVENLRLAYCGENTVHAQIGYPSQRDYCDPEGDNALPLGPEFQELVNTFVKPDVETPEDMYADVRCVIRHVDNSRTMTTHNERTRVRQEELTINSLKILRALLHNEIVKMPEDVFENQKLAHEQGEIIEETQNALTDMSMLEAILNLLSSSCEELTREVLATCVAALHGGNRFVQDRFMKIFLESREEPFFANIKSRMVQTEETVRERRLMATKKEATEKKLLKETGGADMNLKLNGLATLTEAMPHEEMLAAEKIDTMEGKKTALGKALINATKVTRMSLKMSVRGGKTDVEFAEEVRKRKSHFQTRHDCMFSMSIPIVKSIDESPRSTIKVSEFLANSDHEPQYDDFNDTGHLQLVLEVLAGMCDGQNTASQNYLRDQWDNLKTIDVVGETCDFLPLLISGRVKQNSILLVTQLIDTLIEMVQGNEPNQVVAFDHKVLDHVNHILRMSDFPGCDMEQVYALKRSIGILLTDMTEENTESGHTKMIMEAVSKDDIFQVMLEAYKLLQNRALLQKTGQEDLVMTVGFVYHHLLCRAFDLEPRMNRTKYIEATAWQYFMAHTLSIELQKGDTLQRVYFTVEDKDVLRESVKERVKWEVDRSSPSNKLRDFMAWAREVCDDIRYQRKVQSVAFGRWLVNNWTLLNVSLLLLTFIVNMVVLFGWMAPEKYNTDYKYDVSSGDFEPIMSEEVELIILILGCFHIILSSLLLASFLLANRPTVPGYLISAYRWMKEKMSSKDGKRRRKHATVTQHSYLSVDLFSWQGMYYPLLLLFSILGTLYQGEFFAFHMLHIVNQNQLLSRVMQAVTLNGRSMLWVCFLGVIFFYIYAMIGFLFLRNIFLGNQLYCHNLFECFISTIRNGLMFGMADHFDIPEDDPQNRFGYYSLKAIYDISFFALITTIGLNMIFGIIIDTFSQLREAKFQIEQDMMSNCFICNRQSYEFEHHGRGFNQHVKEEHSMWAYLFFFIHLSDTPTNDLTALELYVHDMIEEDGWEFFPLGRALTLSQWEHENADMRMQVIIDQMTFLVDHIKEQDSKKERAAIEAAREAKKQLRESRQKKGLFSRGKKTDTTSSYAHATFGPFMYKLS